MTDIVVTVPKRLWAEWIAEGDLPGEPWSGADYHFWFNGAFAPTALTPGDRVYVVAYDRLRGYAPLVAVEWSCRLRPDRSCLLRRGCAVAVTIPESIRGFRGVQYRWWDRAAEVPFPDWRTP